ncbi:hypothetical protein BKA23_1782 [Rudaeicoccus suwonensis]|uniref:Uncharacterized protein n=1 Tax=Rudaeicoccus suwonensis TaxID=657409 RepID=A0A561EBG8_9MICO|nr:hypothetical protein BKA23_1782 [Rudaeicoccus suwonensis]
MNFRTETPSGLSEGESVMSENKPWFGPKRVGIGVRPQTWQGWALVAILVVVVVAVVTALTR